MSSWLLILVISYNPRLKKDKTLLLALVSLSNPFGFVYGLGLGLWGLRFGLGLGKSTIDHF